MGTSLRWVADKLTLLSATIGALALLAEVGFILVDVIGRANGRPLLGAQDLVIMTMVLVVFGGMALCDQKGGHISVDLFERAFPTRFNRWVDCFSAFLGAIIFLAMAWAVLDSARLSILLNLSTNIIGLPKAWFQWALCGFALVTALTMSLRGFESLIDTSSLTGESHS